MTAKDDKLVEFCRAVQHYEKRTIEERIVGNPRKRKHPSGGEPDGEETSAMHVAMGQLPERDTEIVSEDRGTQDVAPAEWGIDDDSAIIVGPDLNGAIVAEADGENRARQECAMEAFQKLSDSCH